MDSLVMLACFMSAFIYSVLAIFDINDDIIDAILKIGLSVFITMAVITILKVIFNGV